MPPSAPANASVCAADSSPCGSGRQLVRRIFASILCSTRQFIAAAAPATNAIPAVPARSTCRGTTPGVARNMPITAVKTMRDTTRGFVSEYKARSRCAVPVEITWEFTEAASLPRPWRVLQQALQILDHARGIRVAGKAKHHVAERVDDVDVLAHVSGKAFRRERREARAFDAGQDLRTRLSPVGKHPEALDAIHVLSLRTPHLAQVVQLFLAPGVARARVKRDENPFAAQVAQRRDGRRRNQLPVVGRLAGRPAQQVRRGTEHEGRGANEGDQYELIHSF